MRPWKRAAAMDVRLAEAEQGHEQAKAELEAVKAQSASREELGRGLTRVADRNALAERIARVLREGRAS